ncbi:MAG: hypothetical protein FWH32_01250 [Clostridiales bacterium]|nr:hypothetical protein [Clostridiales bacterium]
MSTGGGGEGSGLEMQRELRSGREDGSSGGGGELFFNLLCIGGIITGIVLGIVL